MSGYIYLISMDAETHKIGVSRSPKKRLVGLQDAHPRDLALIGQWRHVDPYLVEGLAHIALDAQRLGGEWFSVKQDEAKAAIAQAIREAVLVNRKPVKISAEITQKGARVSAKRRRAASDAKIKLIRDRWGLPSVEWATADLLAECGLSRNTVQERLGKRPIAQFLYQRALKRRKVKNNEQA